MSANFSFDRSKLSEEDQAILQAFDAIESWSNDERDVSTAQSVGEDDDTFNDILLTFATEVEEEIVIMQQALQQLERDGVITIQRFTALQRPAHKIRGTARAVEFQAIAQIADHIEEIATQVVHGIVVPPAGMHLLREAVHALEATLQGFIETGTESDGPLLALKAEIQHILSQETDVLSTEAFEVIEASDSTLDTEVEAVSVHIDAPTPTLFVTAPSVRVDIHRIEQLVMHTEELSELRTPLEVVQAQMQRALEELHAAEIRLQQCENALSLLSTSRVPHFTLDDHPTSSLIERILNETAPQSDKRDTPFRTIRRKLRARPGAAHVARDEKTTAWDELDMERYTERDDLMRSLSEAVSDVSLAATRVRTTFAQLHELHQKSMRQTTVVRSDTLLLRSAPLRVLIPRIERAITMNAQAQGKEIVFEVTGDTTEIDQHILEGLLDPLLQLLRTCMTDSFTIQSEQKKQDAYRIWLRAQSMSNEVILEIGFSMAVQGGALDSVRDSIARLNGTITFKKNAVGGVSFYLHLPRSQGAVRCLVVRAGDQHVIVPFSHIQRVSDSTQEDVDLMYNLSELLGFPVAPVAATATKRGIQPVLVLLQSNPHRSIGVRIDGAVGEIELIVKPLESYLQRPGISGSAIDGKGNVLLLVDLAERIRYYTQQQIHEPGSTRTSSQQSTERQHPVILIADDSTSIRQSLQHMLSQTPYTIYEASDGVEAMERLMEHLPDIFLLDVEMPNLNGYDLLNLMALYPELAHVKVIVLTSRSSDKHRQRALTLGAHVYLNKPCPQDVLLETIQRLLVRESYSSGAEG